MYYLYYIYTVVFVNLIYFLVCLILVDVCVSCSYTALQLASLGGQQDTVQFLVKNGAYDGDDETVEMAGEDIDHIDDPNEQNKIKDNIKEQLTKPGIYNRCN